MHRTATWICLIAIALLGFGIRVYGLNQYYFSPDDLLHLEIASGDSLREVWRNAAEQMHPPLFYSLIHFLEQVTLDAEFYRYLPVLPGLALIVALFFLGRVVSGDLAGIAMAFVAAFSVGGAILSQVIRPYCLLALLLSVGLTQFVLYMRHRRARFLVCYGFVTLLGVLMHYGAAIQLVAISLVWAGRLAVERQPRREWFRFVLVSAPPFALLAGFYLWHASALAGLYAAIRQSYLKRVFPSDLSQFWSSVRSFFEHMLAPEVWWLGILVVPLGVYAMWRKSRSLTVVVVLSVGINLVLMLAHRYPFGGSRHSFVLFPILAVTLGCAVQFVADAVKSRAGLSGERGRGVWFAYGVGAVILAVSIASVWLYYDSHRFMRRSGHVAAEFPVDWNAYRRVMKILHRDTGSRDVVLANRQTGHYLLFEAGYAPERIHSYLSDQLFHFVVGGEDGAHLQVYVAEAELNFRNAEALTRSLAKLTEEVEDHSDTNVWVANFGWGTPIESIRELDAMYAELAEPVEVARGVQLYRLSGRAVQTLLDR